MRILVLNAGSSSQKICLYQIKDELPSHPPEPIWSGLVDWTHHLGIVEIKVKSLKGSLSEEIGTTSRSAIAKQLFSTLWQGETQVIEQASDIDIVGHRVVHGGEKYTASTLITPEVKSAIADLSVLAPVHNPANLEGIEVATEIFGDVPQIAVFDTAFHGQMPLAASVYPIPYEWFEKGIHRYGFHGISHQYVANRAAGILGKEPNELKIVSCHLGNGCSIAAIQNGHSIDTSMGFTPLEGVMMGSRSGSVDPGILIHLMQHYNLDSQQLDNMLNRESGLKGISGLGDMRQVLAAIAKGQDRAQLAYDMYVHRLRSQIGAMLATLGGMDALIFTAGVGENVAGLRQDVCDAFGFLGLSIDAKKNSQPHVDRDIATNDSKVRVLVIHTEEDWAIAQECWKHLSSHPIT